jgi:putative intracellular protease/amidase
MYILNTMADWETGYLSQALTLQKMLPSVKYEFHTVSYSKEAIVTAGGITIIPDYSLDEINKNEIAALILPGADLWNEEEHKAVLDLALKLIHSNVIVAAICGATLGLANLHLLDNRMHTSNSLDFLKGFSKNYKGEFSYQDCLAVKDKNLITASSAGGLLWARYIIEALNIFSNKTIDSWFNYFSTGDSRYFSELMNSFN